MYVQCMAHDRHVHIFNKQTHTVHLLERDELGRRCSTNTWPAVLNRLVSHGVLCKVGSNHLGLRNITLV